MKVNCPEGAREATLGCLPEGRSLVLFPTLFVLLLQVQVSTKGFSLEGGAPRSEFIIFMIAGGNHTLIPKLSKIGSSEPIFD